MITSNCEEVAKSLDDYHKDVTVRLRNMVTGFALEIVKAGVEHTPIGNSVLYAEFYAARQGTNLPEEEGVAKGAWVVDLNGNLNFVVRSGVNSGKEAILDAAMDLHGYVLGKDFLIGNAAPYIGELEDNYSDQTRGQGIANPTLNQVMKAHEADLKRFFDYSGEF